MAGSIDTQNQTWAKDKSRFGFKMLQKMGWSEGKGLGRLEDGRTAALRARKKGDKQGLGVANAKDNPWQTPGLVAAGLNEVLSKLASDPSHKSSQSADRGTKSSKAIGFYARRAAQKDVRAYSAEALREILGGVHVSGSKVDLKEEERIQREVEQERERKHGRAEKRRKKEKSEKLGVATKIKKVHKADKKKRKQKKEKKQ
ncbi:PIN2/TERF1-interacting telomerase inhibitor 1 [Gracilariopsis chorda]|uniref:PinX1-related protein 1 n=1 Tax=Gracilariopsis chorda TaxID=448386 RepID=A0A2V3J3Q5_9FLOR|nr:PIN2/TERF1-interacting telomerase inhibitor 1 [Gracilariopsis chorda]|eukprot:PXF49081.1 PIN2/TERF1-interacting telomerase inhibitor 1 [Gracilariopsis chorda]